MPKAKKLPGLYCSHKNNQIDTIKTMIAGTYDWIFTRFWTMGNQPQIWTPANQGLTKRYIFFTNGTASYLENNTLKWTNNYTVDYEFKVSTYPPDSATMIIFFDRHTGQRTQYFRPYLCNDSARFWNPYSSFDIQEYYKRH